MSTVISLIALNQSFALTSFLNSDAAIQHIEFIQAMNLDHDDLHSSVLINNSQIKSASFSSSNSADYISGNWTLLYTLCIVLVLINLIVQIKIIFQMIRLFFQFQKMDETI